jgi:hypothetical protein
MRTIQYRVSYEKMITRLPGLFAYLESNEFGEMILHKATDSIDGCYGKIVENIKLPENCGCNVPYYEKQYYTTCYINIDNPIDVITSYEYDSLSDDNPEKELYVEYEYPKYISEEEYDSLGEEQGYYTLIYVDTRNYEDYITQEEYDSISLKQNETYTFRTLITYYYEYKDYLSDDNNFKNFIERGIGKIKIDDANLRKYELVPEFVFLSNVRNLYNQLVKMHKQCELYQHLLENGEKDKHLCCLCEKYQKMGGDDFMEYVKKLIPKADEIATEYLGYVSNESPMTLDFDVDLLSNYQDMGIMTPYAPQWIPSKKYYKGDKVVYDGELYECTALENCGHWDEDLLTVVFDTNNFVRCDNPMGFFNDIGEKDDEITNSVINAKTDTKLSDLRRFVTYFNDDNVVEKPENGFDWLFYYRVGEVVNITTLNDDLGNILDLNTGEAATNDSNLAAYGDVIENIVADTENYTITFIYRLGVHLCAHDDDTMSTPKTRTDDDGNILYLWDKFFWDKNEKIGIKYEETYNYVMNSDLDKLINDEYTNGSVKLVNNQETIVYFKFDDYIKGDYDTALQNVKFEFITYNDTFTYSKKIAHQDVNIVSIINDLEVYRNDFSEFENANLYREDYLNGISYSPTKDINVRIERGSTSVFDKHIKLSEIKTLEDLENYQNGAFFNVSMT